MESKKIVVVGAGGRLGAELVESLSSSHSVTGFTRQDLDLGNRKEVSSALSPLDYDLVVITGALTAVDYCESNPDEAFRVNQQGPEEIAKVSSDKKAKVVYVSTDFVFDGEKEGAYTEEDDPNPISIYGESKLRGEGAVLSISPHNIVVRVSWVYGPKRPAFPEWIIQQAMGESLLALPAEKTASPTSTVDLCQLLQPLLENESASGVFHLCNSGSCSWQEWGQACLDFALEGGQELKVTEIGPNSLSDIAAFVARRPVNSNLETSKYAGLTRIVPRDWKEALRTHLLAGES